MSKVVPGEFLGVSEEFVSGAATFEEQGGIYSTSLGVKKEDSQARSVGVSAIKAARLVRRGDLGYGRVHDLYDSIALVQFEPDSAAGESIHTDAKMCFIRISELQNGYVERLRSCIRIGDIIRARILEVKPLGTYITMKDQDLGVVKAFCSHCRGGMVPDERGFVCPACGSKEFRKVPRG